MATPVRLYIHAAHEQSNMAIKRSVCVLKTVHHITDIFTDLSTAFSLSPFSILFVFYNSCHSN